MSKLNPTFMEEIKKSISSTRFSVDDFTYDSDKYGELLRITFRHEDSYTFILSEEEKDEEITSGKTYALTSQTYTKTVIKLFSTESPGAYKKSNKVNIGGFDSVCGRILKWCSNIHRELGSSAELNEEIENAKRAEKVKFEFTIIDPESKFTNDEISTLKSNLDNLYKKFEELSEKHQISEVELERLQEEIEKMKESAAMYKKGIWAKITQNKITDLIFSLLKSKEGRELIFDSIKQIGS